MYCTKCGNKISDTARFCGFCGNPVVRSNVCPSCGKELEEGMIYCSFCGTRVDAARAGGARGAGGSQNTGSVGSREEPPRSARERTPSRAPAPQSYRASEPARPAARSSVPSTTQLASAQVSWYLGDVKVGVAKATGKLEVYRDRVELQKQFGSSGAAAFGLLGMAVSAASAKKDPTVCFQMAQIEGVRESKYSGAFPAMVITMKNGEKHTFAGTMNARDINNCVKIIQANIR